MWHTVLLARYSIYSVLYMGQHCGVAAGGQCVINQHQETLPVPTGLVLYL